MAVEHAALVGGDRRHGGKGRLQFARRLSRQPFDPFHAIGHGLGEDGVQARDVAVVGRHHQLAAPIEGDRMVLQEGVEQAAAFDTEPRLQGAGRIV